MVLLDHGVESVEGSECRTVLSARGASDPGIPPAGSAAPPRGSSRETWTAVFHPLISDTRGQSAPHAWRPRTFSLAMARAAVGRAIRRAGVGPGRAPDRLVQ